MCANQDLHTTLTQAAPTSWVQIRCQNAQDHLALSVQLHSAQSLPPAAAAPAAMSTHCLLPTWRHGLAALNLSHAVCWNATGQRHLPPADDHGHAGLLARPRNDDECWAVPIKHRQRANGADEPTADGGAHDDELLCPPTSSPTSIRGTFDEQGWVAIN
jgi:hypothetical protein